MFEKIFGHFHPLGHHHMRYSLQKYGILRNCSIICSALAFPGAGVVRVSTKVYLFFFLLKEWGYEWGLIDVFVMYRAPGDCGKKKYFFIVDVEETMASSFN
jgi:hypothetical protein